MGTALVINGLQIRENQEMLTTEFDYYSTHESLRYKAARTEATVREIPLYQNIQKVSEDEIVDTLIDAVRPQTRLITATWVHSSTGLKVPIRRISDPKLNRLSWQNILPASARGVKKERSLLNAIAPFVYLQTKKYKGDILSQGWKSLNLGFFLH